MKNMSLERIAAAIGGNLHFNADEDVLKRECSSVVIDSRKIQPGSLFVATVGERVDGHSFIAKVCEAGALGVICEKEPAEWGCEADIPYLLVENSFVALKRLAAYYRRQLENIRIVGIVGSVGKTSTKELVASVLAQKFITHKTEGNLNNEVGVPLTVLGIRDEHEAAVVEMGISDFGEMDRLGEIVKPDGVVMTNIGPCHLEKLGDLDGVLRAKSECIRHIRKNGFLAVNCEDERLSRISAVMPEGADARIISYGRNGDVLAENVKGCGLEGSEFVLKAYGCEADCRIPLPGAHMVQNALAAAAVGYEFGMDMESVLKGIEAVQPVSGRSNLIHTEDFLLVDDCYNANPKSMKAAIDLLGNALGRRCAILGDMFELGENEAALHAEIGSYAAEHGIDILVCAGALSKNMYSAFNDLAGAEKGQQALYFPSTEELLSNIGKLPFAKGDTILIKASHGMGFSRVVAELA